MTLGALTPLATSVLSATMITAGRKAHAQNGPWASNGGYEYNLVLVAALTALADAGPGRASVDAARFPRLKGPAWVALSPGAAAAGSYLATSERATASEDTTPEAAADQAGDPASTSEEPRFSREEQTQTAGAAAQQSAS